MPARSDGLRDRASEVFARQLSKHGVMRILDLGREPAPFLAGLRRLGFDGLSFSAPATVEDVKALLESSAHEPRAVVLRRGAMLGLPIDAPDTTTLLDSALARTIGAARVAVTTLDQGVLKNALRELTGLAVLYVELDERGTALHDGPWRLDEWLIQSLGFQRASVELAAADNVPAQARFAAVYHRSTAPTSRPDEQHGIEAVDIVTSLGSSLRRTTADGEDVGALWQSTCMRSFATTGTRVVSVSEVEPPQANIAWHRTRAKPSLVEILRAIEADGASHAVVVNGDIALTPALRELLPRLDPEIFHYGNRTEVTFDTSVPRQLQPRGTYNLGYDYFILPRALVLEINRSRAFPESFRVGEPWWDYALPILALALGVPTKRLGSVPPLALHYSHEARYSEGLWIENGLRFVEFLNELDRTLPGRLGSLLPEIAGRFTPSMSGVEQLHIVARSVLTFLP